MQKEHHQASSTYTVQYRNIVNLILFSWNILNFQINWILSYYLWDSIKKELLKQSGNKYIYPFPFLNEIAELKRFCWCLRICIYTTEHIVWH